MDLCCFPVCQPIRVAAESGLTLLGCIYVHYNNIDSIINYACEQQASKEEERNLLRGFVLSCLHRPYQSLQLRDKGRRRRGRQPSQ